MINRIVVNISPKIVGPVFLAVEGRPTNVVILFVHAYITVLDITKKKNPINNAKVQICEGVIFSIFLKKGCLI